MENGENKYQEVEVNHEMQTAYLDYAMSTIISRALPDARDGLKPVQRRILYAMYDMGIRPDSEYKKSARIVGEVLGKYHPHGDTAVYDAMARLAQDFTIRYPLVKGQGNFGSIDGDRPAAMRYTEAKLDQFSMELLNHIEQETVDFTPNFDGTLQEPVVLPSAVPNLLVNGANGIAVGMATNIPPHNIGEVCSGLIYLLENWDRYEDITVDDLMQFIKGPDFPTGGIIVLEDARNELVSAYATGRGRLTIRGRVHIEDMGKNRSRLVITEIPYQVNKTGLIERIADLVRKGMLEGVSDLRDESDRQGMRIVIELSKNADEEKILRGLYKHTPLQSTFGVIMLALVENQPRILSLKQALKVFADHQLEVIRRETEFELNKAKKRAHILEGLLVAIKDLDSVIEIIRHSDDETEARTKLEARFKLDDEHAQAILDMPLKRLTHLEYDALQEEYAALEKSIQEMEDLLNSPEKMREMVIRNLKDVRNRYSDPRRTQIALLAEGVSSKETLVASAMLKAEEQWIGLTADGKIGRCSFDQVREKDFEIPELMIRSDTQQTVYYALENGKAFGVYVESLPNVTHFSEGIDLKSISSWDESEKIAAVFTLPPSGKLGENASVITVTKDGMVKRSLTSELPFASSQFFTLCKVNPGDRLVTVLVSTEGTENLLLASCSGMAIRFDLDDIRIMGLNAAGVSGMKFRKDDSLTAAVLVKEQDACCFVTSEWGLGQIMVNEFPKQNRNGLGVIAVRMNEGVFISDVKKMVSGKALLLLRYGKNRIREVHVALAKMAKRAKSLEQMTKHPNDPVARMDLFSIEPAEDESDIQKPVEKPHVKEEDAAAADVSEEHPQEKKGKSDAEVTKAKSEKGGKNDSGTGADDKSKKDDKDDADNNPEQFTLF